jgi:outer membrane protein TolC
LIGDPKSTPDPIPQDLSKQTIDLLGKKSADLSRGEAALRLANVTDDLRWWSQAPDLTWSWQRNHYVTLGASPILKEWTTTYGVSLTVPLFFFFDEAVESRRARAQTAFDRHNAEVAILNAHSDEEDAAREFQRDKKRIDELKTKDIALAEALVETTFASYKTGKLGFAELLLSRKTLSDLKTQEVQLKIAAIQARLKCLSKCE